MTTNIEVAGQFGYFIAKADYTAAHNLLTQEAQKLYSSDDLKKSVEQMTEYGQGPILEVDIMSDYILKDWPTKQEKDLVWVYVSLVGEDFCEAVIVILADEIGDVRIRYLEWGRP